MECSLYKKSFFTIVLQSNRGNRANIKINAKPVDIVIVHVYIPTTDQDDEEIERMYDKILR